MCPRNRSASVATMPAWAREAAEAIVLGAANDALGVGVQLLRDLRQIFGTADKMRTDEILIKLAGLPESPWLKDHHNGSPLSSRDLSKLLRQYGVRSRDMKIDGRTYKGYVANDLADPWGRYVPCL